MNSNGIIQIFIKRDTNCSNNETPGCGFGVRASRMDGGAVKCINGEFYAPLPLVTFVSPASPAHLSGLCSGDLILSVNGESLEGLNHQTVVAMLKSCHGEMILTIVRPHKQHDENRFRETKLSNASGGLLSEEMKSISSSSYNSNDNNTDELDSLHNNNVQKYVQKPCKRYVNISGFMKITNPIESYIAYHIYIDNSYICSRRFNDFKTLGKCLKENFPQYHFPDTPSKRFFKLNEKQITERMYRLEVFLQAACNNDDVKDSYVMKEFLKPYYELSESENEEDISHTSKGYSTKKNLTQNNQAPYSECSLKILLPDNNLLLMDVNPFADVSLVHNMVMEHLDLNSTSISYFALFQQMSDGFDRKLARCDLPYFIYTQGENDFKIALENKKHRSNSIGSINKSDKNSIIHKHKEPSEVYTSNIVLKKWVFSNKIEAKLCKEAKMLNMIFNEWLGGAVFDDEIAHLIESDQREEALNVIRNTSSSYNSIEFPHCASDSRKRGHVILAVSFNWLRFYPCTLNGEKEKKLVELEWEQIKNFEVKRYKRESIVSDNNRDDSDEDAGIHLDTKKEEKLFEEFVLSFEQNESLRSVVLSSSYSVFMLECCQKILQERAFS